jgi:hypothetical protein
MIKFKIDEVEYKVPDFISIEHYSKIYKIKDLFSDDYFSARLMNIVSEAPLEDLLESDYQEVSYLSAYVMSLIPMNKVEFKDRFELDGVHYGFFPNWKDMTFAEFVDMDTISTKKPEELLNMLHILASVMYRPITEEKSEHDFKIEKYNVESMIQRSELFKKKLDVRYVLGAQTFFTKFGNRFSNYSLLSSIPKLSTWTKIKFVWNMRKVILQTLFKKPTDGTLSSTELLQMTLRSMNLSMKKK